MDPLESQGSTTNTKYKFRDLKTYASTEWLADNKKKYRQVFDRFETGYVYVELSFHNKYFDDKDWDAHISLSCFSIGKSRRKEICNLSFKRKIHSTDDVKYIREGWGNKSEGSYWRKGAYCWEASIDNVKVGIRYFYIEDAGESILDANPYLSLDGIKLYEGSYDDTPLSERIYLSSFNAESTRYVYLELSITNLLKKSSWQSEFVIRFRNQIFELKGQIFRLNSFKRGENHVKICGGWGSNTPGTWREGIYTAEILFMERILGVVQFEMGDVEEQGDPFLTLNLMPGVLKDFDDQVDRSFEQVLADLDALIGLDALKKKVREHAMYLKFIRLRKEMGFVEKESLPLHCVFSGNPGTGKTTVARMIGKLYHAMGLLSKGTVVEVDRSDLIGEFIGQTAPKVKEVLERARGGVLFIDEAYSLARALDDNKDFGREVIEILVKEMAQENCDFAIVVAGYPKEMETFVNSNPGLKSRFKNYFEFPDYYPDELMKIADYSSTNYGVTFTNAARNLFFQIVVEAFRNRTKSFGNARLIEDLVKQAKINLGIRIMSSEEPFASTKRQLRSIQAEDVQKIKNARSPKQLDIPIDQELLEKSLAELDNLIGMDRIKSEVRDLVGIVKYYRQTGRQILNSFFLHTVFVGNPGTGKTTVARILARIFKALGILERGQMIETDRQGLIAGYVGQTAIKTSEKIDEAMGGVLFIDEAYSLTQSGMTATGDFGAEAIQTILKRMEDERGKFFVFVAGYPDNMTAFLKANPGLTSRFDRTLRFDDYNKNELMEIATKMTKDKGFKLSSEADAKLKSHLSSLYDHRDKYFGNARAVRLLTDAIIKKQNLRISSNLNTDLSKIKQNTIEAEDVQGVVLDEKSSSIPKRGIGYNH